MDLVAQSWFARGFSVVAQKHCEACLICLSQNAGPPVKMAAAHRPPTRPFKHVVMDFIELTPSAGKKYCQVMVNMWSKWVEAFPSATQMANDVAKGLLTEIIPRWGIPRKISSDNGTHFANEALTQIGKLFDIDLKKHCAHHPESGGAVERERENGALKNSVLLTPAFHGQRPFPLSSCT